MSTFEDVNSAIEELTKTVSTNEECGEGFYCSNQRSDSCDDCNQLIVDLKSEVERLETENEELKERLSG